MLGEDVAPLAAKDFLPRGKRRKVQHVRRVEIEHIHAVRAAVQRRVRKAAQTGRVLPQHARADVVPHDAEIAEIAAGLHERLRRPDQPPPPLERQIVIARRVEVGERQAVHQPLARPEIGLAGVIARGLGQAVDPRGNEDALALLAADFIHHAAHGAHALGHRRAQAVVGVRLEAADHVQLDSVDVVIAAQLGDIVHIIAAHLLVPVVERQIGRLAVFGMLEPERRARLRPPQIVEFVHAHGEPALQPAFARVFECKGVRLYAHFVRADEAAAPVRNGLERFGGHARAVQLAPRGIPRPAGNIGDVIVRVEHERVHAAALCKAAHPLADGAVGALDGRGDFLLPVDERVRAGKHADERVGADIGGIQSHGGKSSLFLKHMPVSRGELSAGKALGRARIAEK